MTVNVSDITSGPYTGNDVADEFSYDFRVTSKTQLLVFETDDEGVETTLTVDSDYTVTGLGNDNGGLIIRTAGPLPTGYTWYIRSNYQPTQDTSFESQGGYFPDIHEGVADKLTYLIQQLTDGLSRALRFGDSDINVGDVTLPPSDERQQTFIGFDVDGNPEFVPYADASVPTVIIEDQATLSDGQTTVDFTSVDTRNTGFYVAGDGVDQGRLVVGTDYAVVTDKRIELVDSYPAGSIVLAVQNDPTSQPVVGDVAAFDTVAFAKAQSLAVGELFRTKGYYTAGDGGGATYLVAASQTVDGYGDHVMANGNVMLLQGSENIYLSQYGASGSGDDTASIQAALNKAVGGLSVLGQEGKVYSHSQLLVKNGTKSFISNGAVFRPDGTTNPSQLTTQAAVVLQGDLTGGDPVNNCTISLEIDMQNGDRTAILGDKCLSCTFTDNKIYGWTNDATNNHRGIRLQQGASRNRIYNNEIVGVVNPTQRGLLLDIWCDIDTGFTNFGGFFTGTSTTQQIPAERNIITNNILTNGSYALNLQGGENNVFSNNVCVNQNHRAMWVGNGSWYNTISDNQFKNFLSAAVLMGYSSSYNIVSGNKCTNDETILAGGEAVININTGSTHNLIANNHIDAQLNYSVYVATDSSYNVIDGNYLKNAYVAALAVENDWIAARPPNSFYNRPNYGDPTPLDPPNSTSWTYNNLVGTVFQNNIVHSGYAGRSIAAFSIAQIENDLAGATPTSLIDVTLKNNTVMTTDQIGKAVYMYEQVAGQLQGVKMIGNSWDDGFLASYIDFAGANPSSATLDMRDVGLVYSEANGIVDDFIAASPITFADGDTTPDVANWTYYVCVNSSPTNITYFDGGENGQEVIIRLSANTTIKYTSALIRPKGLTDVVGGTSNQFISFRLSAGTWFEQWRNF